MFLNKRKSDAYFYVKNILYFKDLRSLQKRLEMPSRLNGFRHQETEIFMITVMNASSHTI
jgi:hypothetical protein